jgi:hypothetical protein
MTLRHKGLVPVATAVCNLTHKLRIPSNASQGFSSRPSLWSSKSFAVIRCCVARIGLNTTIFSIVDGVLLKPTPPT